MNRLFNTRPYLSTGRSILIAFLLVVGCGGDGDVTRTPLDGVGVETPTPPFPNYYPITVGSWWRYRNPDGSEWTREIIGARKIGDFLYHVFTYNPPTANNRFDFLTPHAYVDTPQRRSALIKAAEIDSTFWDVITENNKKGGGYGMRGGSQFGYKIYKSDSLAALENYVTEVTWHSDFVPLRYPIDSGAVFKVLNLRLNGALEFFSTFHSYEVRCSITGSVGLPQSIVTPAGSFDDCVRIQYDENLPPVTTKEIVLGKIAGTELSPQLLSVLESELNEELKELFVLVMPKLGFENMWLAPGVGPVKIETPNGIAELIDYDIKTVASGQ